MQADAKWSFQLLQPWSWLFSNNSTSQSVLFFLYRSNIFIYLLKNDMSYFLYVYSYV